MIIYLKGDIFSSPAQVLVNTVNTVGVMGKGVALEFKNRYPDMFRTYEKVCGDKQLDIGKLLIWKGWDKWALMFPTKKHWQNPSKLEYVEAGLQKFAATYADKGIVTLTYRSRRSNRYQLEIRLDEHLVFQGDFDLNNHDIIF